MSRLVAQRYAEVVKPPPSQAPGFRKVQQDVAAKKQRIKQHKPAASESRSAQDAAVAPPDDKQAQGKAANAEKMNEAKPGEFDKNAFVGAVNEAIAAQAPKNLDEADGFADSGKADTIKDSVDGKVKDGKKSSAEDIESTTTAAPDTSQAKEKQVTPMGPDQPPGNPGAPSAADAVPDRQPDKVLDFSEGNQQVDQQMADAEVTEEQLAKGNEPQFDTALSEKKKGEQHTASAPAKGRAAEAKQLSAAKAGAAASGAAAMSAMTAERAAAGKAVDGGKGETKSADEKKREQVTAKLQKVFDATQKDVEKILGDLDGKVDKQFTEGEKRARDDFTADHKRRMKQYKDRRYSGFTGKGRWLRDKFKGLPQEGLDIFKKSRELYVTKMQSVISSIADTIGTELGRAKTRIATGRNELKAEVDKLPADLKQFGEEAAADFAGKFDDLESEVNDKSTQLVQDLAQKYTEALNSVDEEIKKLEEENKGLIAKVVDAVVGVIQTINELKNLLLGILAKAAGAVMKILKDPIGFLRNLVSAVGAGLNLFIGNIATHLQKGLVSWLLGTAVSTGLEIPSRFDLKGIIQLIASLLGLTWDNIRARVTRKGVPDEAMTKAEQSVPVAQALAREGPAGAAQEITAETGDLKSTILDDLKSYLIPTVLMAGITWILSLLNPASAFIRAVKGIIDIVTFIVIQGAQIVEFVNSVLDAVVAIANGAAAAVPKTVETALAASIPLLIGLLASLLGIGGLANRVRQAFEKVSRPVNRAIDKIVDKIAKTARRIWSKAKRKSKAESGSGKRETDGEKNAYGSRGSPQKKNNEESTAQKEERLRRAVTEAEGLMSGSQRLGLILRARLAIIKRKYRLSSLEAVRSGSTYTWNVFAKINPEAKFEMFSIPDEAERLRKEIDRELEQLPIHGNSYYTAPVQIQDVKNRVNGNEAVRDALKQGYRLLWDPFTDDSWVLFLEKDEKKGVRRTVVGQLCRARDYVELDRRGDQVIYAGDAAANDHYVLDKKGQEVPRHIVRNVTPGDRRNILAGKGIPRKNVSVIPEEAHVDGRPNNSPYVSGTKILSGDIRNPQGRLFGGKKDRIRIDLSYISPRNISDMTTKSGQREWFLTKSESKMKKIVEDVVRTQEVLIFGEIPAAAIEWLTEEDIKNERAKYIARGGEILRVEPGEDR
ncbi:hypothetical protein Y717_00910 [Streptomyces scopuliridis RB72]|uniref:Uncharacterized protein n=1 Tax=Streptomyces scopuliridis RB72 TaxID=1440053 RepID=A0A2T7T8X2_9ACTN|nr:hypothetical protein Y717_00910 [Streptomyces scopuliridis RB72]